MLFSRKNSPVETLLIQELGKELPRLQRKRRDPLIIQSLHKNREEISTFFKCPSEIWKQIYTPNIGFRSVLTFLRSL